MRPSIFAFLALLGVVICPQVMGAAPTVSELGVVSAGDGVRVSWRTGAEPLSADSWVEVNAAADGSVSGAWVKVSTAPALLGIQTVLFDGSALFADGAHAVRLVARWATGEQVVVADRAAVVDTTPPVVDRFVVTGWQPGGWLMVDAVFRDPGSGVDLAGGRPAVEVAPFDRDRQTLAGVWRRLGDLSPGPEGGVGVDASGLADGQYVVRLVVRDNFGRVARSPGAWVAKTTRPAPVAAAAPAWVRLVRRGAIVRRGVGARQGAVQRVVATVFDADGRRAAGYAVVVRFPDGRGTRRITDTRGQVAFGFRARRGGWLLVRAVRDGHVAARTVRVRLAR